MSDFQIRNADGWLLDNDIKLIGTGTAPSGEEFYCFEQNDSHAWVNTDLFHPDPLPGIQHLKRARFRGLGPKHRASIIEQTQNVTSFPHIEIVERIGWNEAHFGYPDGQVFSPDESVPPIAYPTGSVRVAALGNLGGWKNHVLSLIEGQHIPTFAVMIAFATPLLGLTRLQGNVGFMFSGRARRGKSTCVECAASTCGPVLDHSRGRYLIKFNNTMNRLEEWLTYYNDMPFVIDELSAHGTRSSRQNDFRTLVHHLAGVDERGRMGDDVRPARQTRTIVLITANESLAELLSYEGPGAAEAVEDRMIEIPVPDTEAGVFNVAPAGFSNTRELADAIREQLGLFHGTAMPMFLQQLVEDRAENEDLGNAIHQRIRRFTELSEVRAMGAISSRILDTFGLVWAAGLLANRYGVLPDSIDCKAAAIHCLRLNLGSRVVVDPVQRLKDWILAHEVIDLRTGRLPRMLKADLAERGAFIGVCKREIQFWMAPELFEREFPDGSDFLKAWAIQNILKTEGEGDGKHNAIRCTVLREGKYQPRLLVFKILHFREWLSENGL